MKTLHVKTGDTVVILNGDDGPTRAAGNTGPAKYKRGKVLEVSPKENKVIVEGVNIVTKHVKPRKMGQAGGIIKVEAPMYASKVQLVCPSCDRATRVGHKVVGDKKLRLCKKCGETF